jgi:CHAT domain-containing protein/tetratricopeptide (TPR) repeat protein
MRWATVRRIAVASIGFSGFVSSGNGTTVAQATGPLEHSEQSNRLGKAAEDHGLARYSDTLPQDDSETARRLYNQGNAQFRRCDFAAAKANYEEAVAIWRRTLPPDHLFLARCLNNLGNTQHELREDTAARTSLEEALAIYRKILPPDHHDIASSLYNLGNAQSALRDFGAAKASYTGALAIYRKARPTSDSDIAASLNNLGTVQRNLREFAAARTSFEEALAICRKSVPPEDPRISYVLSNLGNVQVALGEYAAARANHEQAVAHLRKTLPPGHPAIAEGLNNLGIVLRNLLEYTAAKNCHEQALAIRRNALPADHPDIAEGLNNLGNVQHELREFAAARRSFAEALAIRRKALPKHHPDIGQSLTNLGNVQHELGDYAAAKASYEESLAIRREALPENHPEIAESLNNLGLVQYELGEYAAARASHQQALAIRRTALPPDHPHLAFSLVNLARVNRALGLDIDDTVHYLADAADLLHTDQIRLAVAQAEPEQLADAAMAQFCVSYLVDTALAAKAEAALVYDRLVRVKGSVTAQERWAHQARDAADPDTARLVERLRRITRQIVGLSLGERAPGGEPDRPELPAMLRDLAEERARLERQLTQRSAVYRTIQARAGIRGSEVRCALPDGAALLDLFVYSHEEAPVNGKRARPDEERVAVFVVRPDRQDTAIVLLGPLRALAALIDRWRASHGSGKAPPASGMDPGIELRRTLWEPLAQQVAGVKVVLISPDGALNGLPWAALPGSKPGAFLVHEHAFAVIPVPQLLPELLRSRTGESIEPASLAVGNIDFEAMPRSVLAAKRESNFAALPGTLAEAAAVCDLFRAAFAGRRAELLTGKEATKEAFVKRAPGCTHLLVATHGFFLSEPVGSALAGLGQLRSLDALVLRPELFGANPALRSGLVFAGANYESTGGGNAFLTALEVGEMDLREVDLAVLSACETGLGKVEAGEGVLGLQRAMQVAGARTAVTSLWKVPDAATQALMTRLHANLWQKKMAKGEALREAQIWLLSEGRRHPELALRSGLVRLGRNVNEAEAVSPFYWAAFVLSGDWR